MKAYYLVPVLTLVWAPVQSHPSAAQGINHWFQHGLLFGGVSVTFGVLVVAALIMRGRNTRPTIENQ